MTALELLARSGLRAGQRLLIVGATGGVGRFLCQLASQHGVRVIATGTAADTPALRTLGASSVVDYTAGLVSEQVRLQFPDGIDGLVDLVSDPATFGRYTELVRAGGVALTTNYAASEQAMAQRRLRGGNFALTANPSLLERLGADTRSGFLIP